MTLLDAAMDYYRRGWCIIPIRRGTKQAACKWQRHTEHRPTESQLRKWFALPHVGGLAVILGPVSGRLYCRDFDKQDSIDAWTAHHPDLAAMLPTVQSRNGIHVYFTSPQPWRVKKMGDGELRGIGGYCMLPPSIHPDGIAYTWKNPLPPGSIPEVNPITAGMANHKSKACWTEPSRAGQKPGRCRAEPVRSRKRRGVEGLPPITEDQAIASALPTEKHQNDEMLFALARSVLALEQQRGSEYSTAELVTLFDKWHSRNEFLRPDETRDDYWTKFMRAYHNAIVPMGADPVAIAYQKALTTPPPEIATQYTDPKRRLLVSICRELQRMAGNQSFYLSCRVTQQALDLPCPATANNWLNGLITCKILRVTTKGGPHNNRANRYRYLPPVD